MTVDQWTYILGGILATMLGGGGIIGIVNSYLSRKAGVKADEREAARDEEDERERHLRRLESDHDHMYVLLDYAHVLRAQLEESKIPPMPWPKDLRLR